MINWQWIIEKSEPKVFMTTTTDWEELVTTSHLDTVTKIKWLLEEEDYEEAREGIKTLEEIMAKSERKALESQLVRLMWHIIKWNYQPHKCSGSWVRSIIDARNEIESLQKYMPSLNESFIENIWQECFEKAVKGAKTDMGLSKKDSFEPKILTWEQVFEDEYLIEN